MNRSLLFLFFLLSVFVVHTAAGQATYSRLIAEYDYLFGDPAIYQQKVSYDYSHNRSGDLTHTILFDNKTIQYRETAGDLPDTLWYTNRTYSSFDSVLTQTDYLNASSGAVSAYLTEFTYNAGHKPVSRVYSYKHTLTDPYQINGKDEFSYNAKGQLDTISNYQSADGTIFQISGKTVYTYTGAGQLATITTNKGVSGVLTPALKEVRDYNSAGAIATITTYKWDVSKVWAEDFRQNRYYSAAIDSVLYYDYDPVYAVWVKKQRDLLSYDASHRLTELKKEAYYTTGYRAFNLYYYIYTGDVVSESGFLNIKGAALDTFDKSLMTYNAYNQLLTNKTWSGYYEYEYEEFTLGMTEQNIGIAMKAWPVPASDQMCLDIQLPQAQDLTILLYDIQGKVWQVWNIPHTAQHTENIVVKGLAAGNYFLQVKGREGATGVKQITILH